MELNLCCGDDVRDGYINIDIDLESIGFIVDDIRNDGGTNIICWARKRC